MSLADELEKSLAVKGERAATKFLKDNPSIVLWGFCKTGGHSKYALNEFPLGSKYRADFVIPFSYSGVWEIHLIELENTDDIIVTKDGKPSQRLNSAISQVNDWNDYIERNRVSLQQDLADWCMKKDLLHWHQTDAPPSNYTSDVLSDPSIYIRFRYSIIIGRRNNVTKEARRKMNQYSRVGFLDIGTYDRFIDVARNHDRAKANPDERVWLTDTDD